ncbi:MAG TPA: YitT family protein, partial [Desulfobacteria bacterium]|nr:YitT family protein [Desulfobacteria bacterium]
MTCLRWKVTQDYILILFGTLITAIGLDMFLIPNKIAAGGVSGIATIVYYVVHFPVGITML